jgi:hypothetical protein
MTKARLLCTAALASATLVAGGAFAADGSGMTTQVPNHSQATTTMPSGVAPGSRAVGATGGADNTNSVSSPTGAPAQWADFDVPTNFPARDLSLPPRTGSDAIPDYMGPGSVRGQ